MGITGLLVAIGQFVMFSAGCLLAVAGIIIATDKLIK